MNIDLEQLIRHPEQMDKETLYDLRSLLALYPYYQPARLLLLQNLYLLHDPSFDEELRRSAVYITDRKKDMIIVSGFNVYPNEVENVIAAMPGVLEVGVTGVSSPKSGETVKAVIVKKDPALTEEDVKNWCRKELTRYKVPHVIVFVESLPKTPVGKILRRELKDL